MSLRLPATVRRRARAAAFVVCLVVPVVQAQTTQPDEVRRKLDDLIRQNQELQRQIEELSRQVGAQAPPSAIPNDTTPAQPAPRQSGGETPEEALERALAEPASESAGGGVVPQPTPDIFSPAPARQPFGSSTFPL
ncbi:MAG: hypothetical protein IPJ41_03515 [Phycisphaerales bacterium]|nr:hypothetical protein [Phycisphaerales bacterium]